jgi:hypothetical protein
MAQEPDQLRQQIEAQRAQISDTVGELENRVVPSRIAARRTDRAKNRMAEWRDNVFGGSGNGSPGHGAGDSSPGASDRASSMVAGATDTVRHTPEMARSGTKGNPLAAGAIALGAGWLLAGVLPESRQERKLVKRVEPELAEAASAVSSEGAELADELREPAKDAAERLRATTKDAAGHVAHQG